MKYTKLSQIKELYKSIFYIEEDMILDAILAVTIATKLKGDPIWLLIIGGSSSGKSEFINILNKVDFVHPVSSMTENTFLSNMRSTNGKETSLLHRIGTNGMITMKDYTSILSMRSEKRDLIVSQMREIYDGALTKEAGNGNNQHWEGKINWIGAVTDSIYIKEGESAGMGRRTINYVMPKQDRKETTRKSMRNVGDIDEKRKLIQTAVAEFVAHKLETLGDSLPEIPKEYEDDLIDLADFTTLARTPTERNFRGQLILVPDAEMPMRVFSMFKKILQTMIHISDDGKLTEEHVKMMAKLAWNSIPKQRTLTLEVVAKYPSVTKKGTAEAIDYPTDTVGDWLEDLNVVGVVERKGSSTMGDQWAMRQTYKDVMKKHFGIGEITKEILTDADEVVDGNEISPLWMLDALKKKNSQEAVMVMTDDKGLLKEIEKQADEDFNNF